MNYEGYQQVWVRDTFVKQLRGHIRDIQERPPGSAQRAIPGSCSMVVITGPGPTFPDDGTIVIEGYECRGPCPWYKRLFSGSCGTLTAGENGKVLVTCSCDWGILQGVFDRVFGV